MDDSERRTTDSDPDEPPRPVARVNIYPDDPSEDREMALSRSGAEFAAPTVQGVWSVSALGLGVLALLVIVAALILILRGVFQMMPA